MTDTPTPVTVLALHAHQDKAAGVTRAAGETYETTHDRAIERESAGLVRILSTEEAASPSLGTLKADAPPATVENLDPAPSPTSEASPPVPLGDGPAETTAPPPALETADAPPPETKEQA